MTVPTNTTQSYDVTGNVYDIEDIVYDISPTDTPFFSACEAIDADNLLHQWQTDSLAAATKDNAVVEGDDPTADDMTATTMLSNTCQLMDKLVITSTSQKAIKTYGHGNEHDYQILKRAKELKRDVEKALLSENAEVTGDATTARKLGGIESWITTNDSRGTGGADGGLGNTAPTDASAANCRAFTEDLLQNVLQACFDQGGDPDKIYVGGYNKRQMSSFTGGTTKTQEMGGGKRTLVTAYDIYVSDWGQLEIIPSRNSRTRSALVLQSDMWKVAYLQRFNSTPLAKTGHSLKELLAVELTLVSANEAASGIVADLTTSA
jgi:hypothetical protein